MATDRVVIVGAGPAGLATARSYREHGGEREVVLLGAEPHAPYERPPLTKQFLRGELEPEELLIEEEQWFDDHGVTLMRGVEVTALDVRQMSVERADGWAIEADSIVLATGAQPTRPDLPGLDHAHVLTLREIEDSARVSSRLERDLSVIVLGTGFIGCEIAASAAMRGADVTLVGQELRPQSSRLGERAAERIAYWLGELGVELVMDAEVSAVKDGHLVELKDGREFQSELVVLAMGVEPRSELAARAGLSIKDGAIVVDSQLRAVGEVYAVGDVALAYNRAAGRPIRVEHWGDALTHGEIAGRVLAGENAHWDDVPGFWSTIGEHTLKYSAWGDGYDDSRFLDHGDGSFTVWYQRDQKLVGVLTHDADQDYECGAELIARGESVDRD